MKSKHDEILREFEEMMMSISSLKNNPTEIASKAFVVQDAMSILLFLLDPNGYIGKEEEKLFHLRDSGLDRSGIDKLLKEYEMLGVVKKHAITIIEKYLGGKQFDKQIGYLINKIKALPERWQDGIVEQIHEYMDSRNAKKDNLSIDTMETMARIAKTINKISALEIMASRQKVTKE